jgi:hypothetical protein
MVLRLSTLDKPRRQAIWYAEIPCNSEKRSDVAS